MENQLEAKKQTQQSAQNSQNGKPRTRTRRLSWWGSIIVCLFMLTAVWYNFDQKETVVTPPPAADNWIQGYQAALMQKQQIKREWIVSHAHRGSHWDSNYYKNNLGEYKVLTAQNSEMKTSYYFPEADMTFVVNNKEEISSWMSGQNK